MRLATLHRPDGRTLLVNPETVALLRERTPADPGGGNCVVVFATGFEQPVIENLAAAAAMIEGPSGRAERSA